MRTVSSLLPWLTRVASTQALVRATLSHFSTANCVSEPTVYGYSANNVSADVAWNVNAYGNLRKTMLHRAHAHDEILFPCWSRRKRRAIW